MKRFLLFTLLIFSLLLTSAMAEEENCFIIYDRYEGMERPIGSAVLFGEQDILLTNIWAVQYYGELVIRGPGGEYTLYGSMTPTEDSELLLLGINPACTLAEPLQLHYADNNSTMASVQGINEQGETCVVPLGGSVSAPYGDTDAQLIFSREKLLPGTIVLDSQGRIAGMVMAEWGEMHDCYAAITYDTILAEMLSIEAEDAEIPPVKEVNRVWKPSPLTVTYADGALTIDWSGYTWPHEEVQTYQIFFADTSNTHYMYYELEGDVTSDVFPVVPGRSYTLWANVITQSGHEPVSDPFAYAVQFDVPAADPLEAYSFRHVEGYLAAVPAADKVEENAMVLPPMEAITAQALADETQSFFLQVTNTYQVEETIETWMAIALTTPEGYVFSLPSGYIYMPEFNESDVWNAEVTSLFRDCLMFTPEGRFIPGEYTLTYYIGGELGGQICFVLE